MFTRRPQKKNLNIFKNLRKAKSSLFLQILSARIGLASFLFRVNIPDFNFSLYTCGFGEETVQHITFFCNKFSNQRQQVQFSLQDFLSILFSSKLLPKLLFWFMFLKRLDQFNLAHQLSF